MGTEVAVLKAILAQNDPHLLVEIVLEGHLGLKAGLAQSEEAKELGQAATLYFNVREVS